MDLTVLGKWGHYWLVNCPLAVGRPIHSIHCLPYPEQIRVSGDNPRSMARWLPLAFGCFPTLSWLRSSPQGKKHLHLCWNTLKWSSSSFHGWWAVPRAVGTQGTSKLWFLCPTSSEGDRGTAFLAVSREVSRAAGCVNDSEEGLSQGRERLRSQWVEEIGKILWQLESTGWWVWVSSIWEENSDESWDMLASGFGCRTSSSS